jgi:gamma-glutamyltranspeptidase/glutathione hydrolase
MRLPLAALALCVSALAQEEAASPTAGTTPTPAAPAPLSREQARSMIVTRHGIVATSQFLASQAGAKALEAGGNAVDAAIAANAVLGLTQPYVNGIGGDLFVIYYDAKAGKRR